MKAWIANIQVTNLELLVSRQKDFARSWFNMQPNMKLTKKLIDGNNSTYSRKNHPDKNSFCQQKLYWLAKNSFL